MEEVADSQWGIGRTGVDWATVPPRDQESVIANESRSNSDASCRSLITESLHPFLESLNTKDFETLGLPVVCEGMPHCSLTTAYKNSYLSYLSYPLLVGHFLFRY